jgi:hypothetical protein
VNVGGQLGHCQRRGFLPEGGSERTAGIGIHRDASLQIGQFEGCRAVATVSESQHGKQRRVLGDRQRLSCRPRPAGWRRRAGEVCNLAKEGGCAVAREGAAGGDQRLQRERWLHVVKVLTVPCFSGHTAIGKAMIVRRNLGNGQSHPGRASRGAQGAGNQACSRACPDNSRSLKIRQSEGR